MIKKNIRICTIVFLSFVFSCFFNLRSICLVYAEDTCPCVYIGEGCTTVYYIDHDCDGYGVASPKGPDADDNDASVNTAQSVVEKYGTLQNFLSTVKEYNPLHYYFVDVDNGDDSTGIIDDETKPYKTWDAIHGKVKAGDIIIYRAGIHNIPIVFIYPSISGTEENPIIVMAYPGELAIIDRLAAGINVMSSDNLIFDGLTCKNTGNNLGRGVMVADSSNVKIVNIDSGHSTSGLFAMRILHNLHVENSVFHDTYPNGTHCVYLGGMYEANRDIIFRGNLMYNCGMNAFQYNGAATNMLFENNILHSSNMAAISLLMGVSDSVFRNNLGFNNSHGVIIYNYITPLGPPSDQKNNLFINNTFWTGKYNHGTGTVGPEGAASVHFNDYILDPETREPQLELIRSFDNNVFRNNILVTSAGPTMRFDQEDYLDKTVFENNLVYRYGDYRYDGAEYILNYGGTYYTNYDFTYFENFSELIKNNKYSWPEFKDVSIDYATTVEKFNFDHSYNSPAIDFGVSTDAPNFDLRGNLRTGAPDAGCYEYSTIIQPDIQPSAPKNLRVLDDSGQLTLEWDPNTEQYVTYIVYYGDSTGNYTFMENVGNQTEYTLSEFEAGETFYFAVTASNAYGNESDFSEELVYTIPIEDNELPDDTSDSVTIYDDAEDETIDGWSVYDNAYVGATITNVYDDDRNSRVIQLLGYKTVNGYRLRNDDGSNWQNSTQFVIEWSMKYSESFTIYIDVQTTEGHRYIYYTPSNYNGLGEGQYVHHGLGSDVIDGQWHTFARDLQSDLEEAQPGVTILEVNGFLIRGSGKVDDIKLCDDVPID